jgi:hypothetical protein
MMAQNAHLGKTHNVQSEKIRDGVISGINFTKVCFKGKFMAKFQSTVENVEYFFNSTRQTTNIKRPPIENRCCVIDW